MKNADLPAMPTQTYDHSAAMNGVGVSVTEHQGLTKREHFQAMAMQGVLAGNSLKELGYAASNGNASISEFVKAVSIAIADEILS